MYVFNNFRDILEQRKELIMKAAQSKRELLQELKQQAEASALIKEKEKENEMLADKLLLERINREQEEIREQQQAERWGLIFLMRSDRRRSVLI